MLNPPGGFAAIRLASVSASIDLGLPIPLTVRTASALREGARGGPEGASDGAVLGTVDTVAMDPPLLFVSLDVGILLSNFWSKEWYLKPGDDEAELIGSRMVGTGGRGIYSGSKFPAA
jgi:hypothetical protein